MIKPYAVGIATAALGLSLLTTGCSQIGDTAKRSERLENNSNTLLDYAELQVKGGGVDGRLDALERLEKEDLTLASKLFTAKYYFETFSFQLLNVGGQELEDLYHSSLAEFLTRVVTDKMTAISMDKATTQGEGEAAVQVPQPMLAGNPALYPVHEPKYDSVSALSIMLSHVSSEQEGFGTAGRKVTSMMDIIEMGLKTENSGDQNSLPEYVRDVQRYREQVIWLLNYRKNASVYAAIGNLVDRESMAFKQIQQFIGAMAAGKQVPPPQLSDTDLVGMLNVNPEQIENAKSLVALSFETEALLGEIKADSVTAPFVDIMMKTLGSMPSIGNLGKLEAKTEAMKIKARAGKILAALMTKDAKVLEKL
jgi:hypothetical protein